LLKAFCVPGLPQSRYGSPRESKPGMECSRQYVRVHAVQISWCDEVIPSFSRGQVRCDSLLLRYIAVRLSDHQLVLETCDKL
jgi:hypothetical protein